MSKRETKRKNLKPGPSVTVTSLAEIMASLQDQLGDDAKVVEAVTQLLNQGRLRRLTHLDRAA